MIEKLPENKDKIFKTETGECLTIPELGIPKPISDKINELVDVVNELTSCVGQLGVEFTDPTPAKNMQDKFAEQRKWIGKLCWFWNDNKEDGFYDILDGTLENDECFYVRKGRYLVYKHCEPVKSDDDIIYKGNNNE